MRWPGASLVIVIAVVIITAFTTVQFVWQADEGTGWKQIIRSDARGYYGYITAVFHRNDLGNEPFAWEYVHRTPTGTLNKYFSGTAIMMAPWALIAHQIAVLDPDAPGDGFSEYEMKAISIGGWVYLLIGLLAIRALLLHLGIRDRTIAWVILVLGLGTTLLQYAAIQPGWSHIHSFCLIAVWLRLVQRLASGASPWLLIAGALLFGLIVLIRPVNALILLGIPVLLGSGTWPFLIGLLRRWWILLPAVVLGLAVIGIQPLLWHLQTGNWIEWGYRNEGFHWDRPEIMNVLFSFRRGLFIWTPVLLIAAASIFILWRSDRTRSFWTLLYWAINLYVISSWWIWYYGSGFGSRVFVDHYPIMIIPMAIVLDRARPTWWTAVRIFFVAAIALHLVQFVQYQRLILHHELMDARKYVYTFLKLDQRHAGQLGGKYEVPPFNPNGMEPVMQAATDLERQDRHWRGGRVERHPKAYSGSHVVVYDARSEFGITFEAVAGEIPVDRDLWLEVHLMRYEEIAGSSSNAVAVAMIERADGSTGFYGPFKLNPIPGQKADHWESLEFRVPVPPLSEGERLRFFIWNQHRTGRFLIDDPFIRVWAVRPYRSIEVGPAGLEPATKGL